MKCENDGKVIALERHEMDAILRHLEQFRHLVEEFERREREKRLSDGWDRYWAELKRFLESEELEGSELVNTKKADGLYCCQWRTRGLDAGRRTCQQYTAWYIFAWAACVAQAILKKSDATLQAGPCSRMPGCPPGS